MEPFDTFRRVGMSANDIARFEQGEAPRGARRITMPGMEALQTLLRLQSPSNRTGAMQTASTITPQTGRRNQPLVEMLARRYGAPDIANGSYSQQDIEDAAGQMQGMDIERATAPARAQGEYALAGDRIKGDYGLQETGMQTAGLTGLRSAQANAANAEADQTRSSVDVLKQFLSGQGGMAGTNMVPAISANGGVSFRSVAEPKPLANEVQQLTGLEAFRQQGPEILRRLEAKYPGIKENPGKYGGVVDSLMARLKGFAYNQGLSTPDADLQQLISLQKLQSMRPFMAGRPNEKMFDLIAQHLGDISATPGANYERVSQLLQMLPDMVEAVGQAGSPGGQASATRILEQMRSQPLGSVGR